ncbi:MAG: hypothetical protein ONB05_10580 [candidate division KSB1 bacterium]|nr:hypothetical protein [candidate division KSB1 bacterium]
MYRKRIFIAFFVFSAYSALAGLCLNKIFARDIGITLEKKKGRGFNSARSGNNSQSAQILPVSDTTKVCSITLKDGSEVVGQIIEADTQKIRFQTLTGVVMEIPRDTIQKIEYLQGTVKVGRYQHPDPGHTRLFLAPTGRTLRRGEGYFADYWIFFPTFAYGVTDWLTLSGGLSLLPDIGLESQILYFGSKVRFLHRNNFDLAGGFFCISLPWGENLFWDEDDERTAVGATYTVGSFGNVNTSLTFGLGWPFAEGTFADNPVFLIGGETRWSNNIKLLSENWIFPNVENGLSLSFGIRFFGRHLAADLGIITSPETLSEAEGLPFTPWVDFAYSF